MEDSKSISPTTRAPGWMSPEHHGLLDQRQRLLDKKFAGTMTADDEYRLYIVRAQLDAIDERRRKDFQP